MLAPAFSVLAQASPGPQHGLLDAFSRSGPMALLVLGTLLVFSLASWTIMVGKALHFRRAARHTHKFLEVFRVSKRFGEVQAFAPKVPASPLVGIFQAGYAELDSQIQALKEEAGPSSARFKIKSLVGVERTLHRAAGAELQVLGRGTQFLATTAGACPFIGLFGTVWGIMIAFGNIGATGSTSLVAVAPGISEALINTAAGLAAAIPALVAYNYFGARIRRLRAEIDDFILEFINLAERNFT